MEIIGFIIFASIGAMAGWQTGALMKSGGPPTLSNIIIGIFGAIAGGLVFWFLTKNIGGLIGSMVTAVLAGILLLYLMGFFKKSRTR